MTKTFLVLLLAAALIPAASATTFIQECQDPAYRTNNSDAVFTGTVTDFEQSRYPEPHGEITFAVTNATKGDLGEEFTLYQPGTIDGHGTIPAMTLEWREGETYRIQARSTDNGHELVCGEMGREKTKAVAEEPPKATLWQRITDWLALLF